MNKIKANGYSKHKSYFNEIKALNHGALEFTPKITRRDRKRSSIFLKHRKDTDNTSYFGGKHKRETHK